jgi:hypothetical protein
MFRRAGTAHFQAGNGAKGDVRAFKV